MSQFTAEEFQQQCVDAKVEEEFTLDGFPLFA